MAKIKLRKLYKYKIHKNRWLFWAIAYACFVAAAMVGYIKVSDLRIDIDNLELSTLTPLHSYVNRQLGFGVRYPSNWSIEANSATSLTFGPQEVKDGDVSVTVVAPTAEKSIRKSLKIVEESVVTVDGFGAARIVNDLGSDHKETVVLIQHKQKLYVVRGPEIAVQTVLLTFHFVE